MINLFVYDDSLRVVYVSITNKKDEIPADYIEMTKSDRKTVYSKKGFLDIILFHEVEDLEALATFLRSKLNQDMLVVQYYNNSFWHLIYHRLIKWIPLSLMKRLWW